MTSPLRPLNSSARAAGNPVSTLLESGVGNCFPGLEFDVRNLDRRFFPGLVFDFRGTLEAGPDGTQGAQLVQIEAYDDPMLDGDAPWVSALNAAFGGNPGATIGAGEWWLHAITQDGNRIEMYEFLYWQNSVTRVAYEGETVWWLIRSLRPDAPVTIELTQRGGDPDGRPAGAAIAFTGMRRTFVNAEGVFDAIYRPGELTSSMCSPWTHDFRDCACQYWASNHPDVALGVVARGDDIPGGGSKSDPAEAVSFLDWMRRRSDPSRDVSAETTIDAARPYRYDPYEINTKWQELSFVLEGREIDRDYAPARDDRDKKKGAHKNKVRKEGFESPEALIGELSGELAPLELALICEYLYAMFSLKAPGDPGVAEQPGLADALRGARQLIMLTAISEMTHLRWANQILWRLGRAGLYPKGRGYAPVVTPAASIATPHGPRQRALRPLTPKVLAEFVFVEQPGEDVDREYFEVVGELRKTGRGYPPDLWEIAARIDTDGMTHYERFRDVQRILAPWTDAAPAPWLREVKLAKPGETPAALALFDGMIDALSDGFAADAAGDLRGAEASIRAARNNMTALNAECEALFAAGKGVDFFARWDGHGA